jgi:GxxExxY protein
MQMKNIDELIKIVIGAAYRVHNTLGSGFLEKVYEKSLAIELRKQGIEVDTQMQIPVFYDEIQVGDYYADLFVDNQLIVELKAVETLNISHEKQLINYLAGTKIDNGLLINFGNSVVVKRKYRIYKKSDKSENPETELQNFQN